MGNRLSRIVLLLVVLKCSTAVLNLSTTVLLRILVARKLRMLELLAFDKKKSIFDVFCFVGIKQASLCPRE
jgi:hypothetical protein